MKTHEVILTSFSLIFLEGEGSVDKAHIHLDLGKEVLNSCLPVTDEISIITLSLLLLGASLLLMLPVWFVHFFGNTFELCFSEAAGKIDFTKGSVKY